MKDLLKMFLVLTATMSMLSCACGRISEQALTSDSKDKTKNGDCSVEHVFTDIARPWAPSVENRVYGKTIFYAAFLPPNKTEAEKLSFLANGVARYQKVVTQGDQSDVVEKDLCYAQQGNELVLDDYSDNQAGSLMFTVSSDGNSISLYKDGKVAGKFDLDKG